MSQEKIITFLIKIFKSLIESNSNHNTYLIGVLIAIISFTIIVCCVVKNYRIFITTIICCAIKNYIIYKTESKTDNKKKKDKKNRKKNYKKEK